MKIDSPQLPQPRLLIEVAKIKAQLTQLKLGEQLNLKVTAHDTATQHYTLKNNQLQAQVKSPLPLELGQMVKVEVMNTGNKPQLQIISPTVTQQQLQQSLRTLWSHQMPLDQTLNSIIKLIENPLSGKPLPNPINKLLGQLFAALPNVKTLSNLNGLKQTLYDSGMFLESKLAKAVLMNQMEHRFLDRDLKALTLRLVLLLREYTLTSTPQTHTTTTSQSAQQLYPAALLEELFKRINKQHSASSNIQSNPNSDDTEHQLNLLRELLKASESTLARQQLNQLNNSSSMDENKAWGFEIPLNNGKEVALFKLKIQSEQDQNQGEDGKKRWLVSINLTLPDMGPLQAQLTLQGNRLTTHLWSHHPKLFEEHINKLQQRLIKHGLEVDEINFHQGLPKQNETPQTRPPQGLLDVEA